MALLNVPAAQRWTVAARVHTLPAAVTPVLVGAGLAVHDGVFRIDALIWTLIGALAIQVAANFANDASDAHRGADREDRLGPPRMVSAGVITPRRMWLATAIAVAVAAVAGVALTLIAGPVILVIGAVSVVAMLGYVGGPKPYGYRGLGEVFVFVFFGLVATVGSRYVYDSTAPLSSWLLAIPVGMLATAILVANNYRDLETDARAGKRTLAVLLGPQRTMFLFAVLTYGAFPVIVLFGLVGWTPIATLFAAFWVSFATKPVALVQTTTDGPSLIRALKITARLHLLTGLSLAAGAAITI
ncbi:MAG TPA: 1,4-dihydroxy-2-naphthoate polyprenyltransferase [Acidimicrobiia bacterium]|nr:1,4-dihydroxy-2-naphthoate polyprenyltransferase [Acidimicrobiia bacterium]